MRRHVDTQGLRGDLRNQRTHILDGELGACGRRDPDRRFLRVVPEQYGTVLFHTAVDDPGHELRHSPLIAATRLRLLELRVRISALAWGSPETACVRSQFRDAVDSRRRHCRVS